jgi:calcium-dependent protein kinase
MFALGVIIYNLITGVQPFEGEDAEEIKEAITEDDVSCHDPLWMKVSYRATDLMKKLLKKNPKKRLTVQEALEHDFFKL